MVTIIGQIKPCGSLKTRTSCFINHLEQVVLAKVPICLNGSGLGSGLEPIRGNRFYQMNTRTVAMGPVLPATTQYFIIATLAPIKYLCSDRIMTWSIRRLCSFSISFTSSLQIYDLTNTRGVAIEHPGISLNICAHCTAIQRISVGSQIWMLEVKDLAKLHKLCIHHVMIRSELKNLIAAKAVQTVKSELRSGSNPAKNPKFYVRAR